MNIELVNAVVPSLLFTIDEPWATFSFQEDTTVYTVTLISGYYTDSQLITELQTRLNAIPTKVNTYLVTQSPRNSIITITATNPSPVTFTFLFFSGIKRDEIDMNNISILAINTPARLLGFGVNDYVSVSGAVTAPLPMDLENFLNRLYLHLDADGKNLARMEMGAGRQDCFHIFNIDPGQNQYTNLNRDTIHSMFTSSPAPLARISNLIVDTRDEFGRPANLNHREIQLVFEITHLE
jgi:hypothetical protein